MKRRVSGAVAALGVMGIVAACGGSESHVEPSVPPDTPDASSEASSPEAGGSASCRDGVKNGNETDIDCGGACEACPGAGCERDSDCASGVCAGDPRVCQAARCSDGVRNATESDVDCGGPCAPCDNGRTCGAAADCSSGSCAANEKCAPWAATAHNKVDAGTEENVLELARNAAGEIAAVVGTTVPAPGATIVLADGEIPFAGGGAFYAVAKIGPSGALGWRRPVGDGNAFDVGGVAYDPASNVFFSGGVGTFKAFGAAADIVLSGTRTGFVVKYSGVDGAALAARGFGGAGVDRAHAVATLSNGDVVVVGECSANAAFAGAAGPIAVPNAGGSDACVARLDGTTLDAVWVKSFGGSLDDIATVVSVGAGDAIYVAGTFRSDAITFEAARTNLGGAAGTADAFLVRLAAADGAPLWSVAGGSDGNDYATAMAALPSGEVALVGILAALPTAVGKVLTFPGAGTLAACNAFVCSWAVARSGATGGPTWAKVFSGQIEARGACVEAGGDLVIVGASNGALGFGGATVVGGPSTSIALGRLGPNGDQKSVAAYGGDGDDRGGAIACGPRRGFVVGGFFRSPSVTLAGLPVANAESTPNKSDGFVFSPGTPLF